VDIFKDFVKVDLGVVDALQSIIGQSSPYCFAITSSPITSTPKRGIRRKHPNIYFEGKNFFVLIWKLLLILSAEGWHWASYIM